MCTTACTARAPPSWLPAHSPLPGPSGSSACAAQHAQRRCIIAVYLQPSDAAHAQVVTEWHCCCCQSGCHGSTRLALSGEALFIQLQIVTLCAADPTKRCDLPQGRCTPCTAVAKHLRIRCCAALFHRNANSRQSPCSHTYATAHMQCRFQSVANQPSTHSVCWPAACTYLPLTQLYTRYTAVPGCR